jgi:Ca2+-binding RTX toxin-like protein
VGSKLLANGSNGVLLTDGATHNTVGGVYHPFGNLISGNVASGVAIHGVASTGNDVLNNIIGTDIWGTTALANGAGVTIQDAVGNTIGTPDAPNIIALNRGPGITVTGGLASANSIRGNAIYANASLGIDLGGDGLTLNDKLLDADLGPNNLQNFPALQAARAGTTTLVVGLLNSLPDTTMTLDFYANIELDPSGYGEGRRWLGAITVQTNNKGLAQFREELAARTQGGELITATATDAEGNTSEFSGGFMATGKVGKKVIVGGGTGTDNITLQPGSIIVEINGETFVFDDDGSTQLEVHLLAGDDTLISQIANDTVAFGGDGDDFMQLGSGNDQAFGGDGDDTVLGGPGDDQIDGGDGHDAIDGQQGNDQVESGVGDTVETDAGDQLSGFAAGLVSPVSLDGSTAVRGQPLEFQAEFPLAGSAVTWQFGDGYAAEGASIAHVITESGTYALTTVITDPTGIRTTISRDLVIVPVALQAEPVDPTQTALVVGGTGEADSILVDKTNSVEVFLDGLSLGVFDPTGRILVFGQAGDDDLEVAGSIALSAWLYGDAGNDRLKGGSGHDVLLGGKGDDLLIGGGGRDLLIGGRGYDRIVGNDGDDILIAGFTAFDYDYSKSPTGILRDTHREAISRIMQEWTSGNEYPDRIANLSGTGSGGVNGDYYLKTGGPDATVFDDDAYDLLTGAAGLDWFLFNDSEDKTTDLSDEEFADVLDSIFADV